MVYKGIERRKCARFEIPGATVSYKKISLFPSKKEFYEDYLPVLNINRGGILFLNQKHLNTNKKISLKISIPDEGDSLVLMGRVRWAALNVGMSYKYQIGIQFNPYGNKKGENSPQALEKIIALEKKYSKSE